MMTLKWSKDYMIDLAAALGGKPSGRRMLSTPMGIMTCSRGGTIDLHVDSIEQIITLGNTRQPVGEIFDAYMRLSFLFTFSESPEIIGSFS